MRIFTLLLFVLYSFSALTDFESIRLQGSVDLNAIVDEVSEADLSDLPPGSPVAFETEVQRIRASTIIAKPERLKLLARAVLRRLSKEKQESLLSKRAENFGNLFKGQDLGQIASYVRKLRIAFFTGVFNPLHNGHVLVVRSGINEMVVDLIHVMPTVHTSHNETPISWDHRRTMMNGALFTLNEVVETERSFKAAFEQGTGAALKLLFSKYSDRDVQWIHCMGADSFERFVEHGYLAPYADAGKLILLVGRDGVKHPEVPSAFSSIVYPFIPDAGAGGSNSSTKVRKAVKNGESIHDMVPAFVENYIAAHQLYL